MKLLRLCSDQLRLNEPLPWNVRNEPGQLLLSKGYLLQDAAQLEALLSRGVYVDHEEFQAHQQALASQRQVGLDPFALWGDINQRAQALLMAYAHNPHFKEDVGEMSGDIRQVIDVDVEAGMFNMVFNQPDSYAVPHSVQTAFVACLASERFGWSDAERQTITNAALTMNIAMLSLQNTLATQTTPLTASQRAIVMQHPLRGREALEKTGVSQRDWLDTVEQHHVTLDGRGLPVDREDASQLACLIHYSDVYLAKISARASRPAMLANVAARELYVTSGGANNPYVSAIIKEIGIYPPGSFVRLANGDAALVVRRGEHAHTPQVYSLADASGKALAAPEPHDTTQATYKVIGALPREQVALRVSRQALFGYGGT